MTALSETIQSLGFVAKETERSLILVADNPEAIAAASPLIAELKGRDSRIALLYASASATTRQRLAANAWALRVVPPPRALPQAMKQFLLRLNTRCIAFLEPVDGARYGPLVAAAQKLAVAIVSVAGSGGDRGADGPVARASEATISLLAPEPAAATRLAADLLLAIMARDLKPLRKEASLARALGAAVLKLSQTPALAWRFRQIPTLEALRYRLGSPHTILCLGNGPSSEDPALLGLQYDSLFRVNHSWLNRGLFTKPNVVFTGGRPTMRAVSGAIFGVQGADVETRLALVRGLNPVFGRTEFFVANDVAPALRRFDWKHLRPTNGATMLATAVALAPERLIIAGIDLFQHPAGSYPGDSATVNAYSPGHTRESELEFLLQLFTQYAGDLLIFGDILRNEWARYRTASAGQDLRFTG